jgi:hypothetical protein
MVTFKQLHFTSVLQARAIALPIALAMIALASLSVAAQQKQTIAGDYAGTLGPLHVMLHLKADAAGKVTGTLDSTDRGAIGIRCTDLHVDGQSLTFSVPAVRGAWSGTVAADGTLKGTWDQGSPLPLNWNLLVRPRVSQDALLSDTAKPAQHL